MPDYTLEPIVIQLTKGRQAILDAIDIDLSSLKWCTQLAESDLCYAVRHQKEQGKRVRYYLHRVIMARLLDRPLLSNERVDHIDGNGLNNRRDNLRLATSAQNTMNARKRAGTSAEFKGVTYQPRQATKRRKPVREYTAAIGFNGQIFYLGCFATAEEAHAAYCDAGRKLFGEFFRSE